MTGNDFQKTMTTTMKTVKVINNDSHNSEVWLGGRMDGNQNWFNGLISAFKKVGGEVAET